MRWSLDFFEEYSFTGPTSPSVTDVVQTFKTNNIFLKFGNIRNLRESAAKDNLFIFFILLLFCASNTYINTFKTILVSGVFFKIQGLEWAPYFKA